MPKKLKNLSSTYYTYDTSQVFLDPPLASPPLNISDLGQTIGLVLRAKARFATKERNLDGFRIAVNSPDEFFLHNVRL